MTTATIKHVMDRIHEGITTLLDPDTAPVYLIDNLESTLYHEDTRVNEILEGGSPGEWIKEPTYSSSAIVTSRDIGPLHVIQEIHQVQQKFLAILRDDRHARTGEPQLIFSIEMKRSNQGEGPTAGVFIIVNFTVNVFSCAPVQWRLLPYAGRTLEGKTVLYHLSDVISHALLNDAIYGAQLEGVYAPEGKDYILTRENLADILRLHHQLMSRANVKDNAPLMLSADVKTYYTDEFLASYAFKQSGNYLPQALADMHATLNLSSSSSSTESSSP